MNIGLTDEEARFVGEVRHFFEQEYPQDIREKIASGMLIGREDHVRSQAALNARGWLGVGWPPDCGGPDWTPLQRYLFEYELEQAGALSIIPMAVIYIGPVICAFGSREQRETWLPDILESRSLWAQGYSEPESGSDLASLRMTAIREGDDYVLNGTKVWTSSAHWADWIFCLCRTSQAARKQDGLSMICAPMDSAGIRVEPIITIDGSHELNRVIFDNVRVPAGNLIGEEGKAWHYANVLLDAERLSYAHIGRKKKALADLRRMAFGLIGRGELAEGSGLLPRLAACEAGVSALEAMLLKCLTGRAGRAEISALKIGCTEAAQQITAFWLELGGQYALPFLDRTSRNWAEPLPADAHFAPAATAAYFFERAQTIYGGSTEIQKTIAWREIASGPF